MSKVNCKFRNSEEIGIVSLNANHDEKYYKKYGMNVFDWTGCDVSVSIKDLRYINWSDKTGFIRSRAYSVNSLSHKLPGRWFHNPVFFDHTSYWRKPGDRYPSFCLTEPYGIKDEEVFEKEINNNCDSHDTLRLIERFNLRSKFFSPSEKSLWLPNSTAMIFWWCPNCFDFEEHEELLMSHEDASKFEKKLVIEKRSCL